MARHVLGIDPGYDRCGWAVIQAEGTKLSVVRADVFQSSSKLDKSVRFAQLWHFMNEVIVAEGIQELALETLFFSRNVSTALPVSEVRGMFFALVFQHALTLAEYTPQQIKLAVTGYGKADKYQVTQMVCRLLNLEKIPKIDDTGDALAVAVTHLAHVRTNPGL